MAPLCFSRQDYSKDALGDPEANFKFYLQSAIFWGRVNRPALVTWPDLTIFLNQNVSDECLGKDTKYDLDIFRSLEMTQEKKTQGDL